MLIFSSADTSITKVRNDATVDEKIGQVGAQDSDGTAPGNQITTGWIRTQEKFSWRIT